MENETKQGGMSRVEDEDRISYLHRNSRYGSMLLSGLELKEDGPFAHVTVFKDEQSAHRVQFSLRNNGFDACVHISASQARSIASALLAAADDSERLTSIEEVAA